MAIQPSKILKIYSFISLLIGVVLSYAVLFSIEQNENGFILKLIVFLLVMYLLLAGGLFYQDRYFGYWLSNLFGIFWFLYLGVYSFYNSLVILDHFFPTIFLASLLIVVNKYHGHFNQLALYHGIKGNNRFLIIFGSLIFLYVSTMLYFRMKNNPFYLSTIRYKTVLGTSVEAKYPILTLEQDIDDTKKLCYSAEMDFVDIYRTPIVQWNGDTTIHQINVFDTTWNAINLLIEYDTTMINIQNNVLLLRATGVTHVKVNYPQFSNEYSLEIYEKDGELLFREFECDHFRIFNWSLEDY